MAAPPDADGIEDYARRPEVSQVRVSPSNRHAALLVQPPGGRTVLAVVDLADPSRREVIAAYDDVDIVDVQWVNDRRLVYDAQQPGPRVDYEKWGSFAVDRDGSDLRHLVTARSDTEAPTGSAIRYRVLPRGWAVWKPVGDGSDDVFVRRSLERIERGFRPRVVGRVDTRSLQLRTVTEGQPEGADGWWFDRQGRLAIVTTSRQGRRALWWKPSAAADWERVHEWDALGEDAMVPVTLEGEHTLVVFASPQRDTTALFEFDLRRRRLGAEPLVGVEGFDVDAARFDLPDGRVNGAQATTDRPTRVWFDEDLARAQAAVDKALPAGRSNTLLCGRCAGARRFVVHSADDRQPGEYFVYDAAAARLVPLATERPWLDPERQGRRSWHLATARDGLRLPIVVTHPPGMPPDRLAPTVVLVHGGPWAPGATTLWEAEPQFLASRGYRVLQVSFRGTTGLGHRHERAAWKQYGLAMQDDLEDALLWAVRERLTDPGRVCIYGASYGGYAALMGPVRHPGRYRCAVSHVGVTDLTMLFSGNWTDIVSEGRKVHLPRLIGDPEKDAELLRRQSPVHRVGEIKVPVLVAQGRLDQRVSPEHADRFVAAARAAGVPVERVDYDDGHGFAAPEAQRDFWRRLDAFLARHLKQP